MVFKEFGCVFSLANSFIVAHDQGELSSSVYAEFCEELKLLFSPMIHKYPSEFVSSIISFWIYYNKLSNKCYVHLPTFAKIIPSFSIKLDKFLEILLENVETMSNSKQRKPQFYEGKELNVAHFFYTCLET